MLESRHLIYFRTVAEYGSLVRAARALHITQPTLSRQIAQLERMLGSQLFRRTARGVVLTPAGTGLAEHVAGIIAQLDRLPEVIRTYEKGHKLVHVGLPPGVPSQWFECFMGTLRDREPGLQVSLHEATSEKQCQMIKGGLIDIGVVHLQPHGLHNELVLRQRFGCVVRQGDRLAGSSAVTVADLANLRVMAHAAEENHRQEARLRDTADMEGVQIDWVFRSFAEHGTLIAESSDVDVVLVGESSARRHFPNWVWVPFDSSDTTNALMYTWAVWSDSTVYGFDSCLAAMKHSTDALPSAV